MDLLPYHALLNSPESGGYVTTSGDTFSGDHWTASHSSVFVERVQQHHQPASLAVLRQGKFAPPSTHVLYLVANYTQEAERGDPWA